MKTLASGVLAASLLTLAVPASSLTLLPSDPVLIQRVEIATVNDLDSGTAAMVHVAFENTARAAARQVRFLMTDAAGRQIEVADAGTFSSGTTIRHDFRIADLSEGVRVRVVGVTLADGSAWADTSIQAQPREQPAALEGAAASAVDIGSQ